MTTEYEKLFVNSMYSALIGIGAGGEVLFWNYGAERVFGYSADEVFGVSLQSLIGYCNPAKEAQQSLSSTTALRHKNGLPLTLNVNEFPIRNQDGSTELIFIGILNHQANGSHEMFFEDSTFMANLSHELRTPLNAIVGFAELLLEGRKGTINEKQRQYLSDIFSSGRNLLNLLNGIFDLNKLKSHRLESVETISIAPVIDRVFQSVDPILQTKNIHISSNISPDVQFVRIDLQKFEHLLDILISHALKFTANGGEIQLTASAVPGRFLNVVLQHTTEEPEYIFQSDIAAGFDLSLAKKIVELQKGTFEIGNDPGVATRMIVVLPETAYEN